MTVSVRSPTDLCVPDPGSQTLRSIVSSGLSQLAREFSTQLRRAASGPLRSDVAAFAAGVGPWFREQPGALYALLRRPEASVWLRCLRPGSGVDPTTAMSALLATLAFELARRGALPRPLRLRSVPPRLLSGAGRACAVVPASAGEVSFHAGRVEAILPTGPVPLPLSPDDDAFVPIEGTAAVLALADDNPLSALEAHPQKAGNAVDMGGKPATQWTAALADALSIIERHLPAFRPEVELLLHQVVPVGWDEQRHLSASIRESIGTIYLSLHPRPMTMVEAVVHEVSHNKLAALFELDPVLENPDEATHASPVRPDPRPLSGVLLAVHAFVPVAVLYADKVARGEATPDERHRVAQIVEGNRRGAEVLSAHARPTEVGRGVLEELYRYAL